MCPNSWTTRALNVLDFDYLPLTVLAICVTGCSQAKPAIPVKEQRIWVVVLRGQEFLAYEETLEALREESVLPPPPPQECTWHRVSRLRRFADEELWIPGSVLVVVPIGEDERFGKWVLKQLVSWSTAFISTPSLSSLDPNNDEAVEFREALSQLDRQQPRECYLED